MSEHYFQVAKITGEHPDFRRVLWTGRHTQLVVMTLAPGEEIGAEVHAHTDQIISVIRGTAAAVLEGHEIALGPGDVLTVPAGSRHNVTNVGEDRLALATVYGPPEHAPYEIHQTRAEAEEAEESGEDTPPMDL